LAEHTDPTTATGAPTTTTEVLAAIAAEEPHGATADQVAHTIGLGLDGVVVQDALEELVTRGLLDRRELGRGTVYTPRHVIRDTSVLFALARSRLNIVSAARALDCYASFEEN